MCSRLNCRGDAARERNNRVFFIPRPRPISPECVRALFFIQRVPRRRDNCLALYGGMRRQREGSLQTRVYSLYTLPSWEFDKSVHRTKLPIFPITRGSLSVCVCVCTCYIHLSAFLCTYYIIYIRTRAKRVIKVLSRSRSIRRVIFIQFAISLTPALPRARAEGTNCAHRLIPCPFIRSCRNSVAAAAAAARGVRPHPALAIGALEGDARNSALKVYLESQGPGSARAHAGLEFPRAT